MFSMYTCCRHPAVAIGFLAIIAVISTDYLESVAENCPPGTISVCKDDCICDTDGDSDGVGDSHDNCPETFNPGQGDFDGNGIGDACDSDMDGDGIPDADDNCPLNSNVEQADYDGDGIGNPCDPTPGEPHKHKPSPTPTPGPSPSPTPPPSDPHQCSIYKMEAVAGDRFAIYGDVKALELSCLSQRPFRRKIVNQTFYGELGHYKWFHSFPHPWFFGYKGNNPSGVRWLNRHCEDVPPPKSEKQICGKIITQYDGSFASPISLVIDENEPVSSRLVKFAVNPHQNGRYFTWKGSANWPLLVFDPEKRGVVTGAEQLFGDWTFGGKRVAGLNVSPSQMKWENGFEALSVLDQNQDGRLVDEELEPLALWFDHDQDAESDPSEVVPLTETDITALYIKPDRVDSISGDIQATLGYARSKDGKTTYGRMIDWYSESYSSKFDAAIKNSSMESLSDTVEIEESMARLTESSLRAVANSLLGVWRWKSEQKDDRNLYPEGMILFETIEKNVLTGYSVTEMRLQEKPGYPAAAAILYARFTGRILEIAGSNIKFEFSLTSTNGEKTTTSVVLDTAKKTMIGHSRVRSPRLSELTSESLSFEYTWTARPLN